MKKLGSLLLMFFATACLGCHIWGPSYETNFVGTLELTEHSVGARVPGRLTSVTFLEGDVVKKGQVLALLDRYDQASKDHQRLLRVLEKGGTTDQSAEQSALAVDDQRVTSPIDGVVLTKVHESGEIVSAGSAVAVIGESASPWVRIYVPEGLIGRVSMNQSATLRFDGTDKWLKGHVVYVAPQVEFTPRNVQTEEERVTQTFAVKVALDQPEPNLRPGISATVTLDLADKKNP